LEVEKMKTKETVSDFKNRPWKMALWFILWVLVIIVAINFISAFKDGFTWMKLAGSFKHLWIVDVVILAFLYLILFAFFSSIYKTIVFLFSGLGVVLIVASQKGEWITDKVRGYIDTNFDLNYMMGGIAMIGIILALIPIWKELEKKVK
jgi:hypothetical protein